MRKPTLHLVSTKAIKDKYTSFQVYMCDESMFEFDLDSYEVTREDDWINVEKLDDSVMECFQVSNVMRVKFIDVVNQKDIAVVKPVTDPPRNIA